MPSLNFHVLLAVVFWTRSSGSLFETERPISRWRVLMQLPIKIIFSAALVAVVLACTVPAAAADHYLIADQFNNRVIEVDHRGNIVWHFGLGPADFSPASI